MTSPTLVFPDNYPVRLVSVEVDPVFKDLLRPQEQGWLGSDVACSIPLPHGKILWLFGDTFVGTMAEGKRVEGAEFIHNTIGLQDISSSLPGRIEYFWQRDKDRNSEFFPVDVQQRYVLGAVKVFNWPTAGVMVKNELFVFAYRVEVGFVGQFAMPTTLIRVPNPTDPPEQWIRNSYDLGLGTAHQGFHSALFVKEPYVYLLGYDDLPTTPQARRAVLARAKIADLLAGGLHEVFEFWAKSPTGPHWSSQPANLVPLFQPGVTETGIQYVPEWGLYFCTLYYPETPDIYITVAADLTGPWSQPVSIYKVPEHRAPFPVTSYAVRPHPEFSTKPGELIISYATNCGWVTQPLFTKEGAEIYFPRFIRAQFALRPR